VTDARCKVVTYAPDGLGNVRTETIPATGALQFTYDLAGNVLSKTDSRGKLTQYAYDDNGRLILVDFATGIDTVLEYDGGATPVVGSKGKLTKVVDESGQTVWAYNSQGQLTSKTLTTNGKVFTTSCTWGTSGTGLDKLATITYPSGSRANYTYDAYGRIYRITVNPVSRSRPRRRDRQLQLTCRNQLTIVITWSRFARPRCMRSGSIHCGTDRPKRASTCACSAWRTATLASTVC
jgi:YD repeat-containing protein